MEPPEGGHREALPVIADLATGIEFLTAELQAAKEQNAALQHQRDQAQAQADAIQEQLNQAQQANAQLQAEAAQFHHA